MTKLHTPSGDIKFTSLMKLIYAYIWTFQENKKRGNDDPIHTNTDVIAWEMGVSEKALIAALMALDAAGVVIKHTVKVRGIVNSSNYVAIPPASVVVLGITPPKPGKRKATKKSDEKKENGKSEPASPSDVNEVNPAKPGCTEMQAEPQTEQAAATVTPSTDAPTGEPADTPAYQSANLASGSAPDDSGQRDSVASNDDGSSDAGTDSNNAVNQAEEQEDHFPWKGDTFIKNRLSENAYKWALTAGATDWHHACRLVWEKVEVTPPTEIDECYKPLSLC